MREEITYVEKYRPKKIDECVLPDPIKNTFKKFVEAGSFPNLILSGSAGLGKTTIAKALCHELDFKSYLVNASESGNIDTLRNDIRNFASTISFNGKRKVVILDEADYLNPNSTQPALRGFMEEFSKNASFILTCNHRNRIIPPLHSRCSTIEFQFKKNEKAKMAMQFLERVKYILTTENVSYTEDVLIALITKHFPDFRRILNEIEKYSKFGQIDNGILAQVSNIKVNDLMNALKDKNFDRVRKWVVQNGDNDPNSTFRSIYDALGDCVTEDTIPLAILKIADYMYKSAFVADQEINTVACLIELAVDCEFKK